MVARRDLGLKLTPHVHLAADTVPKAWRKVQLRSDSSFDWRAPEVPFCILQSEPGA